MQSVQKHVNIKRFFRYLFQTDCNDKQFDDTSKTFFQRHSVCREVSSKLIDLLILLLAVGLSSHQHLRDSWTFKMTVSWTCGNSNKKNLSGSRSIKFWNKFHLKNLSKQKSFQKVFGAIIANKFLSTKSISHKLHLSTLDWRLNKISFLSSF